MTLAQVTGIGHHGGLRYTVMLQRTKKGDWVDELEDTSFSDWTKEISGPGDSGAIWGDPVTGEPVALHARGETAAGPKEEFAIGVSVKMIEERLDVRFPGA